jgi:hypothetical protein
MTRLSLGGWKYWKIPKNKRSFDNMKALGQFPQICTKIASFDKKSVRNLKRWAKR